MTTHEKKDAQSRPTCAKHGDWCPCPRTCPCWRMSECDDGGARTNEKWQRRTMRRA